MIPKRLLKRFRVQPGAKVRVSDYATGWAQTKALAKYGEEKVKKRAQVVREPFLLRAQTSVRQHQVDGKGERRGAEFLRNDRGGCLHDAGRPVIFDSLGGGCEHLVQPVATVTAEQLHPSDDMFDAVCFVS